jgi:hypothetical protein
MRQEDQRIFFGHLQDRKVGKIRVTFLGIMACFGKKEVLVYMTCFGEEKF